MRLMFLMIFFVTKIVSPPTFERTCAERPYFCDVKALLMILVGQYNNHLR